MCHFIEAEKAEIQIDIRRPRHTTLRPIGVALLALAPLHYRPHLINLDHEPPLEISARPPREGKRRRQAD